MSASASSHLWLRLGNTLAFGAVLAANAAAGSGAMSGVSIGTIANDFPSLFLPAGYVFAIWSLIYLWLAVALVYQWGRGDGSARALQQLGLWWGVAAVLNIAWVSAFAFRQYALALGVMVLLLAALVITGARLRAEAAPSLASRVCVRWAHDLYLAWIAVALIANLFQFAHVIGFGGAGLTELQWSLTMMVVATLLGWFIAATQGHWIFPFVVAWAIAGIGARYPEVAGLATAGSVLPWLGMAGGVAAVWMGAASRRRALATD